MAYRSINVMLAVAALAGKGLAAVTPEMTLDERYLARRALKTGQGTRYGDSDGCTEEDCWQSGACAFTDYTLPDGIDGSTCVSEEIWNDGANCGGCISVTYKGKTITVMVSDLALSEPALTKDVVLTWYAAKVTNRTGGGANHLDMTPATWAKLTNGLSGGGVDGIEWDFVACPIAQSEPLWIKMHNGASQYWVAATVENARRRTDKLEVSGDEGKTWKATTRNRNNFFVMDGTLDSDSAWVRVTSHTGTQVVVKNVALKSEQVTKAGGNYA